MNQDSKNLLLQSRQHLSTIFGNTILVGEFVKNPDFQLIVEKLIKIHDYLEKQNTPELLLTDKYIGNFERLSNRKINFSEVKISIDLDDLADDIKYTDVFCRNIFSKPLSDFTIDLANDVNLDDDKPLASAPTIDGVIPVAISGLGAGPTGDADKPPLQGQRIPSDEFKKQSTFATENDPKVKNVGFNPELFNQQAPSEAEGFGSYNPMAQQLANQRLQIELLIGKVYRWTEKPRAIILLQYIALAFSILFFLTNAATIVAWIVASVNGLVVSGTNAAGQAITSRVQGSALFSFIIGPIIMLISGIVLTWRYFNDSQGRLSGGKMRRYASAASVILNNPEIPKVNDNMRYHLQISTIIIVGLFYILFNFIPFSGTFTQVTFLQQSNIFQTGLPSQPNTPEILGIYYTIIISLASFGPLVIIVIVAYLLNPKVDIERLTQLIEQYAKEAESASGGNMPGAGPNGPFGGMGGGPFGRRRGPFGGGGF
ncbi:MPN449 family protein [[Mycoplasma] testudinis]|uniref:MPN449 family protein n=1 Tax=[Mycoplasma] testudinis TaxID=33924 RepID=UPI00048528EC|nr:hypothetical protein [[Mycoplasma] testudinis]